MDTERGNLEILFQKIPYCRIDCRREGGRIGHDYRTVDERLYLKYARDVFPHNSEDEIRNKYQFLKEKIEGENVFLTIWDFAGKVLIYDGNEIKCRIDEMLRWREISFQLGQDLFTCAFLANQAVKKGIRIEKFSWAPIILSDDRRLYNILKKGIAENHFHLNGSAKIFELNWICLMNLIENRRHDFKKISDTLQTHRMEDAGIQTHRESLYEICQKAALYRIYLFACLREDDFLLQKVEEIHKKIEQGIPVSFLTSKIQDIITLAKYLYGAMVDRCETENKDGKAVTDEKHILDYALEKTMIHKNNNECRLLSGERKFLYDCFEAVIRGKFDEMQSNVFYRYLSIRTRFRGELIQVNRQVGFANFSNYERRKEAFIEQIPMYEEELIRLAINEPLSKDYMKYLEARICPSDTPSALYRKIQRYQKVANESSSDKLSYILHFPKEKDTKFEKFMPRHYILRKSVMVKSKSIAKLLNAETSARDCIRGIDACANEVNCRPEVFAQSFRFLSDIMFESKYICNSQEENIMTKLCTTYHAGEDFLDIVDGIRAMDEAMLFCGLGKGSRIGHGLALGIDPYSYYCYKGKIIVMEKQRLLDNIVWLLCKSDELGIDIDRSLRTELEGRFYELYKEIYDKIIGHEVTLLDYYHSWKLRGDNPALYWQESGEIKEIVKERKNAVIPYDRYGFNDQIENIEVIRDIGYIRKIYHAYHFNKTVREKGNEMITQKVGKRYADVVKQVQDCMIHQLVMRGIGIESNPSSNYLIGTIKKYDEHPILRFNSRKLGNASTNMSLSVSINTDDQGVFDTLLENEYALMLLALKKARDDEGQYKYDIEDIYEWIDYVRDMGMQQVFNPKV